jgi:hypothetical protein
MARCNRLRPQLGDIMVAERGNQDDSFLSEGRAIVSPRQSGAVRGDKCGHAVTCGDASHSHRTAAHHGSSARR